MIDNQKEQKKFESFCKRNDLNYDFSFLAGKGTYYRSSETNKAFCIFKWAQSK